MTGVGHGLSPAAAQLLERRRRGLDQGANAPKRGVTSPGSFRLTPAHARLWVAQELDKADARYNLPAALRLRGPLELAVLDSAVAGVQAMHAMLRAQFAWRDGDVWADVSRPGAARLTVIDLTGASRQESCATAEAAARDEAISPFDLAHEPPVRFKVLSLGPDDHVLLLTAHHIACDGWSLRIVIEDLAALYGHHLRGHPLPPPTGLDVPELLACKSSSVPPSDPPRLQGSAFPLPLALPADRPRSNRRTHRGARLNFELDSDLASRLRLFSRSLSVTSFTTGLAAYAALLGRLSGQSEVVVGVPVAGRTDPETQRTVGMLMRMAVFGVSLADTTSFSDLVGQVWPATLAALDPEGSAGARLPESELTATFQFLPAQDAARSTPNFGTFPSFAGLDVAHFGFFGESTRFDLEMQLVDGGGGIGGTLNFASDLFDRSTVCRLARQYLLVLRTLLGDPDMHVNDVPLLDPAAREALVTRLNANNRVTEPGLTVHKLFERRVAATPDVAAIEDGERVLTYAEVDDRAEATARALAVSPAGEQPLVALHLHRGANLAVAMLGVLRAGAGFVPLDPAHPPARLSRLLGDSGARLLVVDGRPAPFSIPPEVRVVDLAGLPAIAPGGRTADPLDLAYVVFTSGSTGSPKGVAVTHHNFVNLVHDPLASLGARPGDRCSMWTSPGFDVAMQEVLCPLAAGATLIFTPDHVRLVPEALFGWLAKQEITIAYLPPFMVHDFSAWLAAGNPSSLRQLMVGVEPLPEATLGKIAAHLPEATIVNGYGPAEATVCSAAHVVQPTDHADRPAPIGRPVANVQAYVLDGDGKVVPPGVTGELHLGGAGVARGYIRAAAATAARFVPDHCGSEAGTRLYQTGDLARYRADGVIEFVGRSDDQIKRRGVRIEPGEVELAVRRVDGVRDAAVVSIDREAGDADLVAYVVAECGLDAVDNVVRHTLPSFMVPRFVGVPHIPRNLNGKVDRRALASFPLATPAAPVVTHQQTVVAALIEEVLEVAVESRDDNFFGLGGDSLQLVALQRRLVERLGITEEQVPLSSLYEAPTVAAIAALVQPDRPPNLSPAITSGPTVVRLQPGGPAAAAVCIHALGGEVGAYQALAARLAPGHPVYAVRDSTSSGQNLPAAADYGPLVAKACPDGPLAIVGWSYGALIGLETARQLRDAGRTVALLVLDATAPQVASVLAGAPPTTRDLVSHLVVEEAHRAGRSRADIVTLAAELDEQGDVSALVQVINRRRLLTTEIDVEWAEAYGRRAQQRLAAFRGHRPLPFDGPISLFLAADDVVGGAGRRRLRDRTRGWRDLSSHHVQVTEVPGSHITMLEPPAVDELAGAISLELDRLDATAIGERSTRHG